MFSVNTINAVMLLLFEDLKKDENKEKNPNQTKTFHPYGASLYTTATVIVVANHN